MSYLLRTRPPFGTCNLAGVPAGTWDITTTGPHTLSNVRRNVVIGDGGNFVDMGTLLEGDVNGSGGIFINDIGLMIGAFFSECGDANYNPNADLNNTCGVFINDVTITVGNFFQESPIELD